MINKLSIRTKFILIISLLLASVLSLQFYFTNRVHRDIIAEIEQMTRAFNKTTGAYFFGTTDSLRSVLIEEEKILTKNAGELERLDNLQRMIGNVQDSLVKNLPDTFGWNSADVNKKISRAREQILKLRIHTQTSGSESTEVRENGFRFWTETDADSINTIIFPRLDSLEQRLNRYQVHVDSYLKNRKPFPAFVKGRNPAYSISTNPGTFSFIVPDFTVPAAPRLLEYRYDPDELNSVIRKMRNRNALITLGLFALSIIGVVLIARRFSRPIRSLNASFDRVVQGDLTVSVTPTADDEIGELTRSFNKMVAELKKNREKENLLQRKERLASLGQLAAGVAHEVKNPLNAINLTIEHLQDKFVDAKDEQASDYIRTIQGEIRRLDKTVNNFLNYIRSENLERKPADIGELLDEILNLYERELISGRITVVKNYNPGFVLQVDRERLKTALVNILLNAVQAIDTEGTIHITADPETKTIVISDTGRGMEKKNLDHIFDLFYTTKSGGTGLGLPTAYKIIREHHGDITISSRPEKGTNVTIRMS